MILLLNNSMLCRCVTVLLHACIAITFYFLLFCTFLLLFSMIVLFYRHTPEIKMDGWMD